MANTDLLSKKGGKGKAKKKMAKPVVFDEQARKYACWPEGA